MISFELGSAGGKSSTKKKNAARDTRVVQALNLSTRLNSLDGGLSGAEGVVRKGRRERSENREKSSPELITRTTLHGNPLARFI